MRIIEQRFLRGPNLWTGTPCMLTLIDLEESPVSPADLAAKALALQQDMGMDAGFSTVAAVPGQAARWRIVTGFQLEKVAQQAMQLALDMAVNGGALPDQDERLEELKASARRGAIGTSTAAVVNAARARGIPALRITEEANLFQLGWGSRQKRLQATMTGDTSHVAVGIAGNKQLTKTLLDQNGIPVPKGGVAATAEEALALAARLRFPVTLKPLDGNQGKGVTTRCMSEGEVGAAFDFARQYGRRVIVERFIEGSDYRVLVTGGTVAAAALRRPPSVLGDGSATVQELVDTENRHPARGEGHANILTRIALDEHALDLLREQGLTPSSVPAAGMRVRLRGNANLSTGGTAEDVTDQVHPSTRSMCIRAAQLIGLDVAGIDIVCGDIAQALPRQSGALIEVNAAPGIRMHEYPSAGQARNAGDAIVQAMFGDGDGRIPVIAVTGTNGKTTTTLMIGHTARLAGLGTGVTTTEGVHINGERVIEGDCAGYHSARSVLASHAVDIAVLETARGGILKRGLAFDSCSVGVVLNVSADHLGLDGIETVDELARVKAVVANSAARAAVLNADDRHCVAMAAQLRTGVETIYFAMSPDNEVLLRHVNSGGRAAWLQDGDLMVADSARTQPLMRADAMPATMGGHARYNVANGLAAAAALLGAGFTREQIAAGLASFVCDAGSNPLRSNVFKAQGVTVVIDYAHNPAAYAALGDMARSMAAGRRVAVITSPGDRREADLRDIGRTCAAGFDELFVYEADPRGRASGETAAIILDGAREAGKEMQQLHAIVPVAEAFAAAFARCGEGDILVFACGSAATAAQITAQYCGEPHAATT